MNAKLQTSILINLAGNLQSKARQYGQAFDNLGNKATRNLGLIRGSANAAMQGLDNLGNVYSGMAAGFVSGTLVKGVADFDTQMTRLKTDSNMTAQELAKVKQGIMDVSTSADFALDRAQVAGSLDRFIEQTGDIDTAAQKLDVLAAAMQGYGVSGEVAGLLIATMHKNGVKGTQDQMAMLDTFFAHFQAGSLSVTKFAEEFPELVAMLPTAHQNMKGITELSKFSQVGTIAKVSAPEMTTAMKSMFSALNNEAKQSLIESQGVQVYADAGRTIKRNPFDVFMELIEKTKIYGDRQTDILAHIFDQDAAMVMGSFGKVAGVELWDKLNKTQVEYGYTLNAAKENAKTFGASLTRVKNVMDEVADENLAEPMREFADWLENIDKEQMEWIGQMALAVGGMVLAVKTFNGVGEMARNAKGFFGKKDKPGAGNGADNGLSGILGMGITPVYVVNMPGSNWGSVMLPGPLGLPDKSQKGDADFPDSPKHKPNRWAGVAKGAAGLGTAYALYETSESIAQMLAMPAMWAIDSTDAGQWLAGKAGSAKNNPLAKTLEASSFSSLLSAVMSDAVKTVSEPLTYDVPNSPLKPELQGKIEIEMVGGQPRVTRALFGEDIETFVKNGYTMGALGG